MKNMSPSESKSTGMQREPSMFFYFEKFFTKKVIVMNLNIVF